MVLRASEEGTLGLLLVRNRDSKLAGCIIDGYLGKYYAVTPSHQSSLHGFDSLDNVTSFVRDKFVSSLFLVVCVRCERESPEVGFRVRLIEAYIRKGFDMWGVNISSDLEVRLGFVVKSWYSCK